MMTSLTNSRMTNGRASGTGFSNGTFKGAPAPITAKTASQGGGSVTKRNGAAAGNGDAPTTPPRNPLIDDLLDELSPPDSDADMPAPTTGGGDTNAPLLGRPPMRDRPTEAPRTLGIAPSEVDRLRSSSARQNSLFSVSKRSMNSSGGATAALSAVVASTTQHFVHAMRMNQLDGYFTNEDSVTRQQDLQKGLAAKSPEELHALVGNLIEMLEDVRVADSTYNRRLSINQLLGDPEKGRSGSLMSTMSTASLMRPPVAVSNQVAMAYDNQGNVMINRYTVIANLGRGAYGKVKLGEESSTGNKVAIKIIEKSMLKKRFGSSASGEDNGLNREIAIMKKIRHRNCVSLHEVIDDPSSKKLYLIMDYVPNGPVVQLKQQKLLPVFLKSVEEGKPVKGTVFDKFLLRCAVRQSVDGGDAPLRPAEVVSEPLVFLSRPVQQSVCAIYLRQLVSGLRYLHKRDVVHHDIKPDNILLGYDHHVYFTDFGVSEILRSETAVSGAAASTMKQRQRLGGGTLLFTAPELLDKYTDQSAVDPFLTDVWALGVTVYCLLIGYVPFSGSCYADVCENILKKPFPWNDHNAYGQPLMPEWRPLLDGMMNKSPTRRWPLLKLKRYLDSSTFQDALEQQRARDALEAATMHSRLSSIRPSMLGSGLLQVPTSANSRVTTGRGSLSSLANRSSSAASPNVVRIDTASQLLEVNYHDVKKATKQGKVDVLAKAKTQVSPHTRKIVRRYVEDVRRRVKQAGVFFSPLEDTTVNDDDDDDDAHQIVLTTDNTHRPTAPMDSPLPTKYANMAVWMNGNTQGSSDYSRAGGNGGGAGGAGGGNTLSKVVQRIGSGSALDAFLSMVDLSSGDGSSSLSCSASFAPRYMEKANEKDGSGAQQFIQTKAPSSEESLTASTSTRTTAAPSSTATTTAAPNTTATKTTTATREKKLPYLTMVNADAAKKKKKKKTSGTGSNGLSTSGGADGRKKSGPDDARNTLVLPSPRARTNRSPTPAGRNSGSTCPTGGKNLPSIVDTAPTPNLHVNDDGPRLPSSIESPAPLKVVPTDTAQRHRFRSFTTSYAQGNKGDVSSDSAPNASGIVPYLTSDPDGKSSTEVLVESSASVPRRGSRVSGGKLLPAMTSIEESRKRGKSRKRK